MRIILSFPLSSDEIADAIGCEKKYKHAFTVEAIVTDSREAEAQDLFVALEGDSDTGEKYIYDARNKGAYILSKINESSDFNVSDTALALLKIAKYYKTKFEKLKSTVAITGSVGKTTTKNIVAKMLSKKFKVHKTHENFNNFLGVAHTLFSMPKDTEILVCELGMNHAGEIRLLSKVISPDLSVITNIGSAHIGNLGSREAIASAKLEILGGMKKESVIIPYDEPLLEATKGKITFSLTNNSADCFIETTAENTEFTIADLYVRKKKILSQTIELPGRHILFGVAIGALVLDTLAFSAEEISDAIDNLHSESTRGKIMAVAGLTFYDDTYSSSPEALIADFDLVSLLRPRKISCVLGDMLELGDESERLHKYIGKKVFEYGFDKLFTFGENASYIAQGAIEAGMSKNKIYENSDVESPEITARQVYSSCSGDEIILCKASHSIRASRIYEFIEKLSESEGYLNA